MATRADAGQPAVAEGGQLMHHKSQQPAGQQGGCDTDAALRAAGEFGRYQKLLFAAMIPFAIFFAHVLFVQMFVTARPQQYWCRVPELRHLSPQHRWALAIPLEDGAPAKCAEYDVNWTALLETGLPAAPDPAWRSRPCAHGVEFNHSDIPYPTIATELEWVCERDSYATVAQVVFFFGSVVGGLLFGWMADRYGRIPALVGCNLVGCAGGVASVFARDLLSFSASRFLVGLSYDNCFMMMYIIVLEYVGARYRTRVANMSIALFFGLGCVTLPWLALWLADWRRLLLATSLPMLIVCAAPFLVPESIRWLLLQGRVEEAARTLRRIARVNGKRIPDALLQDFQESARAECLRARLGREGEDVRALWAWPRLRRALLLLTLVYMCCAVAFDALVRLSDSLGLDFFLAFTLTSATEMPSVTLLTLTLDRWGRRALCCWPMFLSGVACLVAILVPAGVPSASLAIAARFCINMSYNAAIQWAAELLPTGVRAGGTGLIHIAGYIATALSPCIVYLGTYVWWLPLACVGCASGVGGAASALLPETAGRDLPQTFRDAERLSTVSGCFPDGGTEDQDEDDAREMELLSANNNEQQKPSA